jgi:hypothetical protein
MSRWAEIEKPPLRWLLFSCLVLGFAFAGLKANGDLHDAEFSAPVCGSAGNGAV